MIKIKPFLIATLLLTGFALPAVAQIGEARNILVIRAIGRDEVMVKAADRLR